MITGGSLHLKSSKYIYDHLWIMETLDGVLYVEGGEGGGGENFEHELLGHTSVVARLVSSLN